MTTTLSTTARHYARRFSGGITPSLSSEITASGGGRGWFGKQLYPTRTSDPFGTRIDGWFPSLHRTPEQIFERQKNGTQGAWQVMEDLSKWTVSRRIHSTRQVQEVLVDFWSNLLHVPLGTDDAVFWRVSYDQMIRKYALTSFEELLLHATVHPAMGINLGNSISTKDAPNENLGRELLELHTVGLHYSESDVKSSARILTGYRVDVWWPKFQSYYDPKSHATGKVKVLGFNSANTSADGRATTTAYLKYLAHHPLTAQRIARRLCVKFVSDNPSAALVSAVAKAYTRNGTAIKPTLLAMVDHPEFVASAGAKIRTPIEDYVATIRALGIQIAKPTTGDSFANAMYWQYHELGQAPYEWPAPNGFPEVNAAWTSAGRILTSFGIHRNMAAQWWPTAQATYPSQVSFLPTLPATLQVVLDHVGLRILGQLPGAEVSKGVATLLGMSLSHPLTSSEAREYWTMIAILSSLLDSPIHLHR